MNINEQCKNILTKTKESEAECKKKLEAIKERLSEICNEVDNIELDSNSSELHQLRLQIISDMRKLKRKALSFEGLDPMKVLEARQDITMWVTKGESCEKMIKFDINNNDKIRIKAWLSINQDNLQSHQRFDTEDLESALINCLYPNQQLTLEQHLQTIERVQKTNSTARSIINDLKSSIKSNGLSE